ncbi:MAG: hypothetical protein JWQ20_1012 [Conexibacter sp.]|jgi:hypothetical protein|nr:hypothetical protein [Conexibacter sp.]
MGSRSRTDAKRPPAPAPGTADPCVSGVCGSEAPPLVGSVLTGTGLTLAQAAAALERGEQPALTDVQRRIVERWALERGV